MNDIMSGGLHRLWKDRFVFQIRPSSTDRILDVAGGTGDIAFRLAKHRGLSSDSPPITVSDINPDMLAVGQSRDAAKELGAQLKWIQADAEKLPFEDASFDLYTIAFGIRNVTDIPQALREAHRVLRPGGKFYCLEFCPVDTPVLGSLYDLYSFQLIPVFGHLIAGDWESYQYLVESIRRFPKPEEFARMIGEAGFAAPAFQILTPPVAAIHSGVKL